MSFFTVNELPGTEMLPGVVRRAVYLEHAMITFFDFAPGSVIPEHDHPHEQITYVLQGTMEFRLGDERHTLRAGDGVCCPPNIPHSAVILDEPTVALDAWYPLREEYK
ncbi:MAG: cupin domain-containing protein [Chloroflexota bacterium]|nr:cupin domain-containing protein [Chloroflexota bacterium]